MADDSESARRGRAANVRGTIASYIAPRSRWSYGDILTSFEPMAVESRIYHLHKKAANT